MSLRPHFRRVQRLHFREVFEHRLAQRLREAFINEGLEQRCGELAVIAQLCGTLFTRHDVILKNEALGVVQLTVNKRLEGVVYSCARCHGNSPPPRLS